MSPYEPSDAWFSALNDKLRAYNAAKEVKAYAISDALRKELIFSGVIDLDSNPRWHPVFESPESRSERLTCPPR